MRITFVAVFALCWGCREVEGEECPPPLPDGSCPAVVDKALSYCVCGDPPASSDDIASGSAVNSDWGCLGQDLVMAPREPGRVQYTVPVVDFFTQPSASSAVPGLEVKVCSDADCSSELPICESDSQESCYGLSIDGTELTFDFPFGFEGALRFAAPNYVDLDYSLGGPMVGTRDGSLSVSGRAIAMLSVEDRQRFYGQLGRPVDASRGTLMAHVARCDGLPADSVNVTALQGDFAGATAFTLADGSVPHLGPAPTDEIGAAGYVNVAPQIASVAGETATGETVASAPVRVRSGAIALVEVRAGISIWGQ